MLMIRKAEAGGSDSLAAAQLLGKMWRSHSVEELAQELSGMSGRIILAGDGAELAHKFMEEKYELAPYPLRYQRGSGVCLAAEGRETIDPAALMPSYLRLPQAERERLAREGKPVE